MGGTRAAPQVASSPKMLCIITEAWSPRLLSWGSLYSGGRFSEGHFRYCPFSLQSRLIIPGGPFISHPVLPHCLSGVRQLLLPSLEIAAPVDFRGTGWCGAKTLTSAWAVSAPSALEKQAPRKPGLVDIKQTAD